jgi:hypothetical protein
MAELAAIPVLDVRDGGPVRHAHLAVARARALRDTCVAWFPGFARPLVPLGDRFARRWLERTRSPYFGEVRSIAAALGFPGIWFLNGSYQWSCTALAREQGAVPWLARTLDWPFPGLGRYVDVVRMQGPAGEFFNATWAGYVGVLTACAPGRFGASINQAPMRRRTRHLRLRPFDIAANAIGGLHGAQAIPPDQLLRQVFETCRDYAAARRMLEVTPIARPVIYTLAGVRAGECCVIERTGDSATTREHDTCAANDWLQALPHWEARMGPARVFTSTYEDAAARSRARRERLAGWSGDFARDSFGWVAPPVLNPFTRMAIEMCPAEGLLRVTGYERVRPTDEFASAVTLPCEVRAERPVAA